MTELVSPLLGGRYRLIEKVGSGLMSTVYRAEDMKRNQMAVAVKLLNSTHEDELRKEVFRRETSALERFEHPNIVEILDYNWSDERHCYYIVLEYIPQTLGDKISAHQRDPDRSWHWRVARAIADALRYAHSKNVIHRDLKPTNILVTDDGTAKLTDFGSSLLKLELGNAITLASFWTPRYASPEQHRNENATERSDIYSFGCVLYHLLSGQEPPSHVAPSEGITAEHIRPLGLSPLDARMLESMVASRPEDRMEDAVQLCLQLEHTKEYDPLPEVWFVMTNTARKILINAGFIRYRSDEAVNNFLFQDELGGEHPKEVYMSFDPEKNKIRVLTDRFTLDCIRNEREPAFTIVALYLAFAADHERQKQRAIAVRYRWKVTTQSFILRGRSDLDVALSQLIEHLQTRQRVQRTALERKNERRDFTREWNAVLDLQRKRLRESVKLAYTNAVRNGNILTFTLAAPVPDDLSWPEHATMALVSQGKNQSDYQILGQLLECNGTQLRVALATTTGGRVLPPSLLPRQGSIGLALQDERAAVERQSKALSALLSGATVNTRLMEVLQDLSQAIFDQEDEALTFYQPSLTEEKQRAVKKALAARDLFLLQGPPGTGKTTVLAEIVMQILNRKSDARILVTSQSNVAVDNILLHISELCHQQGIEIIRLGREGKIGQSAEEWTIEKRLDQWREQILTRTDLLLAAWKEQLRTYKQQRKRLVTLSPEEIVELEQWKTWLEDLEPELQGLVSDEQYLITLERSRTVFQDLPTEQQEMQAEYQEYQDRIVERREQIASVLVHVRSLLSEADQEVALVSLAEEQRRLRRIVLHQLGIDEEEARLAGLQKVVQNWQKVAATYKEGFAGPLLERASILAATCLIVGSSELRDREFDWAIIDEAGRATAPELLIPLVRARRAIIVGDEKQLPPMVDGELRAEELAATGTTREALMESLFGLLVKQAEEAALPVVQMLTVQHRMHPAIGRLISHVFYEGRLEHAATEEERSHDLDWIARNVTWFSTTRLARHEETSRGSSYYNRSEVEGCVRLLHRMETSYRVLGQTREVAVITPYQAQLAELQVAVRPSGPDWQALQIEIAVIDAFQGRDSDIVLYSPVRSNKQAKLGFLRDHRRLNVALSRARQLLLLIGDLWTLENGAERAEEINPYRRLIRYLREHEQDCAIEPLEEA